MLDTGQVALLGAMNFCGGELDHQVHDTKLPDPDAAFCGPCVKIEDVAPLDKKGGFFDEDEQQAQFSVEQTLDIIQETIEKDLGIKKLDRQQLDPPAPSLTTLKERLRMEQIVVMGLDADADTVPPIPSPVSAARQLKATSPNEVRVDGGNPVDDEQEDEYEDDEDNDNFDRVIVPGIDADHMMTRPSSFISPVSFSRLSKSSSATYLYPVEEDWIEAARRTQDNDIYHGSKNGRSNSSIDGLMKRLENGFRVQLHHRSSVASSQEVLLYLTADRTKICLQSDEDEKKDEDNHHDYWQEISCAEILRLEIGGKSRSLAHPMTSFSIVLSHDDGVVYYDFEADSPIEREIIVSTLMVVLEQAQKKQQESNQQIGSGSFSLELRMGGTMDQPIPCSPSLEVDFLQRGRAVEDSHEVINLEDISTPQESFDVQEPRDTVSPELDIIPAVRSNLSRTSAYSRSIRPVVSRDTLAGQNTHRRQGSRDVMPYQPRATEDVLIEFDTSGQLASAWCADDICSFALKDIADTCYGIFALKQDRARCTLAVLPDEQLLMIEEYITTALGAPSAVYAYLSEFDVWRADAPQNAAATRASTTTTPGPLRNRASILNAQATRLRKLRNEMTFAAALRQSKQGTDYVQTTQSFDDVKFFGNKELKTAAERFHSSALLQSLIGNMAMPVPPVKEEEVAYYDSDPEDARSQTMHKRGPRKVGVEKSHRQTSSSSSVGGTSRRRALSGGGFDKVTTSKRLSKKLEEETISQLVQVGANKGASG